MFISKKELAERDERLRRAQEEIESLKQTIRELQSEVADDRPQRIGTEVILQAPVRWDGE